MTIKAQQIVHEAGMSYTVETHNLVQQVVGETILAILATDNRNLMYTTFDRDLVNTVVAQVVDQVRKHWNFSEIN